MTQTPKTLETSADCWHTQHRVQGTALGPHRADGQAGTWFAEDWASTVVCKNAVPGAGTSMAHTDAALHVLGHLQLHAARLMPQHSLSSSRSLSLSLVQTGFQPVCQLARLPLCDRCPLHKRFAGGATTSSGSGKPCGKAQRLNMLHRTATTSSKEHSAECSREPCADLLLCVTPIMRAGPPLARWMSLACSRSCGEAHLLLQACPALRKLGAQRLDLFLLLNDHLGLFLLPVGQ